MVFMKHEQTGISLEQAVDELQKDFEVAMETVVTAIRQKHNVTEQQMTQVLMLYQSDAEVEAAVKTLREVRAAAAANEPSPAGRMRVAGSASTGACGGLRGPAWWRGRGVGCLGWLAG